MHLTHGFNNSHSRASTDLATNLARGILEPDKQKRYGYQQYVQDNIEEQQFKKHAKNLEVWPIFTNKITHECSNARTCDKRQQKSNKDKSHKIAIKGKKSQEERKNLVFMRKTHRTCKKKNA